MLGEREKAAQGHISDRGQPSQCKALSSLRSTTMQASNAFSRMTGHSVKGTCLKILPSMEVGHCVGSSLKALFLPDSSVAC